MSTATPPNPAPVPTLSTYEAHRLAKTKFTELATDAAATPQQKAVYDAMTQSPTKPRLSFAERRKIVTEHRNSLLDESHEKYKPAVKTITQEQFDADFNVAKGHADKVVKEIETSGIDVNATYPDKAKAFKLDGDGNIIGGVKDDKGAYTPPSYDEVDVNKNAHKSTVRAMANDPLKVNKDGRVEASSVEGIGERMKKTAEANKDKPLKEQAASVFKTATNGIKTLGRSGATKLSTMGVTGSSVVLGTAAVATVYGLYKTVTAPFKGKTVDEEGNVKEPTLLKKTANTVLSAALTLGGIVLARHALSGGIGQKESVGKFTSMLDNTVNRGNWMQAGNFRL